LERNGGQSKGRPNVVCRGKGTGEGGGPLLLTGHVDVVPVDREKWTQDPFGGEIVNGYLYGRGAIDMKNMVTMCMHVTMLAAQAQRPPSRDIIFAAVSDEELGCTHGSKFLVEQHPDWVRAEYMIGEVGGFSQDVGKVRYYPVQVAERGIARLTLTALGTPGHGSIPHGDMAIAKLAKALDLITRTRLPLHPTATMTRFLEVLASTQPAPARWVLPKVLNPRWSSLVLDRLIQDRDTAEAIAANLSNTAVPTLLHGGQAINVIPGEVSAQLDGRLIPGQRAEDLVEELHALVGDLVQIRIDHAHPGREHADVDDDPLFQAICDTILRHDPQGVPLPYMVSGFTDAAYFGTLGATCFGYSPLRFPREDKVKFKELFHGHDERIHVEGFRWGLGCLWDLVARFTDLAPSLS